MSEDPLTVCPVEAVGTVLYCSQLGRSLFGFFVGVTPTETVVWCESWSSSLSSLDTFRMLTRYLL
jgi:hypothetical protein